MHAVHTCLLGWAQSDGLFLPVNRSIQFNFGECNFVGFTDRAVGMLGVLEGLVVVTGDVSDREYETNGQANR